MTAATRNRKAQSHSWAAQVRLEFATLVRATEGMSAVAIFEALATEAVIADDGTLCDSRGEAGYAWNPQAQLRKKAKNPAGERVKAAGASLGRVLCGGHPDHRTYLAFIEALYVVTTQQDYDVAARIEMLWDAMASEDDYLTPPKRRRHWWRRAWVALLDWWRRGVGIEQRRDAS